MNDLVDVFIPIGPHKECVARFPAALYSALTQMYQPIRVILFLDGVGGIEPLLDKWWYTSKDKPRENLETYNSPHFSCDLTIETCERGVVVRNRLGPSGSAGKARQWLFEWGGKSDLVKMLDSDDILTPGAVGLMLKSLTPEVEGVYCPLVRCSHFRLAEVSKCGVGSGCMLLRKRLMKRMVDDGFVWPVSPGHDMGYRNFTAEKGYKFAHTDPQALLYLYLK